MRFRRLTTGSMSVSARPRGHRGVAFNWQRWPALVRRARRFAVLAAVSALAVPVLVVMAGTAAAVTPGSTASQTILDLTPNPSTSGDSVRMHVRVMDQSASCTGGGACVSPTGFIYFSGFSNSSGNCICITLQASPSVPGLSTADYTIRQVSTGYGLSTGTYQLRAYYEGDATFAASQDTQTQVVNKASTTTTLTQSADTTFAGQSVTLTALVDGYGSFGGPTGSVQFYQRRKPLRPPGRLQQRL